MIAYSRYELRIAAILRRAHDRGSSVTVPASALAQVWRGSDNHRLASLLSACTVEPMDEHLAKRVGVLCGLAGTTDIVDASVVIGAAARGDAIVTSDYADLAHLAGFLRGLGPIIPLA